MDPDRLAKTVGSLTLNSSSPRPPAAGGHFPGLRRTTRPVPAFPRVVSDSAVMRYCQEYSEWIEEDNTLPPQPLPPLDRQQLISYQRQLRVEYVSPDTVVTFRFSMVGFPKHTSSAPLRKLRRIPFSKMYVRQVHTGYYVLCRIISPCIAVNAVQTVVEDPDGNALDLSIYNFPTMFGCTAAHVDAIFPPGMVIAIREPTLKAPAQGPHPFLRVDSPTDIAFVSVNSDLLNGIVWRSGQALHYDGISRALNSADIWRQRGDAAFEKSNWLLAAFSYSHALALHHEAPNRVLVSRGRTYLRMGYFSGAIYDSRVVLSQVSSSNAPAYSRALLCLARALYGRGEYHEAQKSFIRFKSLFPDDEPVDSWLQRCAARIVETTTGVYDWPTLFRASKVKSNLDVADFIGPVAVREMASRGGGRGVVATRAIKAGELLMATKAFAVVHEEDVDPTAPPLVVADLLSKSQASRTSHMLFDRIVEKIYGNPDLHDVVFHLYAGPNYPPPPSTYPPPPSIAMNVEPLEPTVNIDVARLECIMKCNGFSPHRLGVERTTDTMLQPAGLFPTASMFNHSCVSNARWYCIGDLMTIRAAEPIPEGAEIMIPYVVDASYLGRQEVLQQHMIPSCDCSMCEDDRRDGEANLRRRHELNAKLALVDGDKKKKIPPMDMPVRHNLQEKISDTYSPTRAVRPLDALALHAVAQSLGPGPAHARMIQRETAALQCCGFDVTDPESGQPARIKMKDRIPTALSFMEPADMMLSLAHLHHIQKDNAGATHWIQAALWLTNISIGGGKELFMLYHERALGVLGLTSLAAHVLRGS
ncbi:hypothetical protein C8Q77DRAFT_1047016 [Trametes polyzona]|nr:hypothetical protein C8Q77DRAFT_1047016 [Trametes polyzona]